MSAWSNHERVTTLLREEGLETLNVHSVESLGTFDGPGIRYVLFLQGCPFRCLYCANPDTMAFDGGQAHTLRELTESISHMKSYFGNGGGVTISGGEPCCQARNLKLLFKELRSDDIHTALDTNGAVMNRHVKELLDETDLVLLDVKHINASMHEIITGRSNTKTLAFADYLRKHNKPTWLRYVLVPGLTDKPEDLHAFGNYFKDYQNIEKLEIQPYHELGTHKWQHLGKEYPLEGTPQNTQTQLETARGIFQQYFKDVVVN